MTPRDGSPTITRHREASALRRVVSGLTVDVLDDDERARDQTAQLSARHVNQIRQIKVSGKVGARPEWGEARVYWEMPFLMRTAPGQSGLSEITNPHFNYGVYNASGRHVIIIPQVTDWFGDESDFVTGAKVQICAWQPSAPKVTKFEAVIHFSFMGYAGPTEEADQSE